MANIFVGNGTLGVTFTADSLSRYIILADNRLAYDATFATETSQQLTCRSAGTASHLRAIVTTNSRITASTLTLRKNTANGNNTVSITAGTTGTFEDTTHSDTLADGDLWNARLTTSTGGGTLLVQYMDVRIAVTSGSAKQICGVAVTSVSTDSQTNYISVAGTQTQNGTESAVGQPAPVNLTLSNLQVYVTVNSRTTNTVFTSRVSAGAGNHTVTFGAGVTGLIEDTTHSDSVTAGQLYNVRRVTSTGGGTITHSYTGFKVVTDGVGFPICSYGAETSNSTYYYAPIGAGGGSGTEADFLWPTPFAVTASKLSVNVSANTSVTDMLGKTRKNTADGNQVATITALTTGVFQDTTHSDLYAANDNMDYSFSGQTLGPTLRSVSMFLTETTAGVVKTWDGLALASTKTINGLALASVKTINGAAAQ